jgi:hypothetical protein
MSSISMTSSWSLQFVSGVQARSWQAPERLLVARLVGSLVRFAGSLFDEPCPPAACRWIADADEHIYHVPVRRPATQLPVIDNIVNIDINVNARPGVQLYMYAILICGQPAETCIVLNVSLC